MKNLYEKLMSLDDSLFERLEREEAELLKRLGAKKLHDLDNVALGKNGELYALEDIKCGGAIVEGGNLFMKSTQNIKRGEKI